MRQIVVKYVPLALRSIKDLSFEKISKKLKKVLKKVLTNLKQCDIISKSPQDDANGSIAQLGEHLPYKQRVIGSSPIVPTIRPGSSVG